MSDLSWLNYGVFGRKKSELGGQGQGQTTPETRFEVVVLRIGGILLDREFSVVGNVTWGDSLYRNSCFACHGGSGRTWHALAIFRTSAEAYFVKMKGLGFIKFSRNENKRMNHSPVLFVPCVGLPGFDYVRQEFVGGFVLLLVRPEGSWSLSMLPKP